MSTYEIPSIEYIPPPVPPWPLDPEKTADLLQRTTESIREGR